MKKRVLFVLTSHAQKGNTGQPTGAYLAEISHPYFELSRAGVEVDFVSVRGGQVPLDGVDKEDPANAAFLADAALLSRLHHSMRPDQVDPAKYDGIFYAGGHGAMWDLPHDETLARVAATLYERGKVVAAVCHGPAGLVNIKLQDGSYLVQGKEVAAFTNAEEAAVGLTDVVPFLLADKLEERGAKHKPAPDWAEQVVVSDRLVTGQNPASAKGVGQAMLKLL
jgi:putative intracellular protease/amidase